MGWADRTKESRLPRRMYGYPWESPVFTAPGGVSIGKWVWLGTTEVPGQDAHTAHNEGRRRR